MKLACLLTLLLSLCAFVHAGQDQGTVRGSVHISGMATYRGVAALWKGDQQAPDPRRYLLIPFATQPLQENGDFELQAPQGDYYVGAIVRQTDGSWQGPPRPGDQVFLSPDSEDASMLVSIEPGSSIHIGKHSKSWTYEGMIASADQLYISGRVVDERGEPLSGLMVFAFSDPEMSRLPLVVSSPTDDQGRYRLQFKEPATIYLRVRDQYGQRNPAAGGYMGVYGSQNAIPVRVEDSQDQPGLEIRAIKVPPLDQRQKSKKEGH